MEHPQFSGHPLVAGVYAFASLLFGSFASIANNVELWVRIAAGVAAITAAVLAGRYHWYATKEKINSLKNNQAP